MISNSSSIVDDRNFRSKLISKTPTSLKQEKRELCLSDMNSAYTQIQQYDECRSLSKRKMNRPKYRSTRYNHVIHLFDEFHKDLKNTWEQFGYLNRSTSYSFATAILPALNIVYYNNNIQRNEEDKKNKQNQEDFVQ